MGLAKVLLFSLNFILFLVAVAAIAFAAYVAVDFGDEDDLDVLLDHENLGLVAWCYVGAAVFIMLVALAGCCGAWKENKFLLFVYIVLLSLFVLFQIGVTVAIIYFGSDIKDHTEDWLLDSLKDYDDDPDEGDDDPVNKAWNNFQEKFDCCGVKSYQDWVEIFTFVPYSCCKELDADGTCPRAETSYFEDGCLDTVVDKIEDNADILMYAGIGLGAVQVFCLLLACCAINSFRKEIEYA